METFGIAPLLNHIILFSLSNSFVSSFSDSRGSGSSGVPDLNHQEYEGNKSLSWVTFLTRQCDVRPEAERAHPFLPGDLHRRSRRIHLELRAGKCLTNVGTEGDPETAELLAEQFVAANTASYAAVAKCLPDDLDACLVQLRYPRSHRKFIRTTNLLERAFVEEKRRTKIIPSHINERGALKLVFGSLIRASDSWRRVAMTQLELTQLRTLRSMMCPQAQDHDKISFRLAA